MKIPQGLISQELLMKLGVGHKLTVSQIWDIFKHMFILLREQSTLWTPIIRMIMTNLILLLLFIIGFISIFKPETREMGIIVLIISIGGTLLRGFYFGYLFGLMSAMVYLYLQGKAISLKAAQQIAKQRTLSLSFLYILTQFANAFIHNRESKLSKSKLEILLLGFISSETFNVLGHILVPIIVIENVGLHQSVIRLKEMRQHIPETLAGVFGVDITNKVLGITFLPFTIIVLILSFTIGHHFYTWFPINTVVTITNATFSWLPIAFALLALIFILSCIRPTMDGLKIIYFTLLYAITNHPEQIQDSVQKEFKTFVKAENTKDNNSQKP